MRSVLAVLLVAHAVAHVVGFAVPWRLAISADVPYRTTIVNGLIDLGPAGIKAVGVIWLLVAVAFGTIGVGVLARTSWWYPVLLPLIGTSVVLCVLQWPDTRFGLLANGVILALLLVGLGLRVLTVP
jgi:hypothetical protein